MGAYNAAYNGAPQGAPDMLYPGDHVTLDNAHYTLEGRVENTCDMDSVIVLTCDEDGEVLRVNGWLFTLIEYNGTEL
jgi:hypothetical protein